MTDKEERLKERKKRHEETLAHYTLNKGRGLFKYLKNATLYTQYEVYTLAKEFIEWFEFVDGPQRYTEKYTGNSKGEKG